MAFNKLTFFLTEKENKVINFNTQKVNLNLKGPTFVGKIPINGEDIKVAAVFETRVIELPEV
jgi:hypothetical protein